MFVAVRGQAGQVCSHWLTDAGDGRGHQHTHLVYDQGHQGEQDPGVQYGYFFQQLGKVEQLKKADRYMFPHYKYYVREVKIKAYAQLLESYKTIKLSYMADTFGVMEDYIDRDLGRTCERSQTLN